MSDPNAEEVWRCWPDAGEIASVSWADYEGECVWVVGQSGVTRIEKAVKTGEMSYLPYVRVWKGDILAAEHSQHRLTGVFFKVPS